MEQRKDLQGVFDLMTEAIVSVTYFFWTDNFRVLQSTKQTLRSFLVSVFSFAEKNE